VKKPAGDDPTLVQLLKLLDQAFDRKSWHGPNLRGSLRGLTARRAAWRPARARHNIHELVVHAAYWKYAVRRRLTGEKRGSFAHRGSNWFPRGKASEAEWRRDLALLAAEHKALRAAIARLRPRDLAERAPGSSIRIATLIRGAAAHDLYHAGQIQLLKRLQ
jgi:DinB family protein